MNDHTPTSPATPGPGITREAAQYRILSHLAGDAPTPPSDDLRAAGLNPRLRAYLHPTPHQPREADTAATGSQGGPSLAALTVQAAAATTARDLAEAIEPALTGGALDQLIAFAEQVAARAARIDTRRLDLKNLAASDLVEPLHTLGRSLAALTVLLHFDQAAATPPTKATTATAGRHTDPAPTTAPQANGSSPPKLTGPQKTALRLIQRGYVRIQEFRIGKPTVDAGISTRISMATINALQSKGLIRRDTTTSLYHGQRLLLTPAGHAAYTAMNAAPATPPAPTPGAPATRRSR